MTQPISRRDFYRICIMITERNLLYCTVNCVIDCVHSSPLQSVSVSPVWWFRCPIPIGAALHPGGLPLRRRPRLPIRRRRTQLHVSEECAFFSSFRIDISLSAVIEEFSSIDNFSLIEFSVYETTIQEQYCIALHFSNLCPVLAQIINAASILTTHRRKYFWKLFLLSTKSFKKKSEFVGQTEPF